MAFDPQAVKEIDSLSNRSDGGQVYVYVSKTDTVQTMSAANYFNGLAGTVKTGDTLIVSAFDTTVTFRVTALATGGIVTVKVTSGKNSFNVALVTGNTSLGTDVDLFLWTLTGANTATLPNASAAGRKFTVIIMGGATGTNKGTLTPFGYFNGTNIVLTNLGEAHTLTYTGLVNHWADTSRNDVLRVEVGTVSTGRALTQAEVNADVVRLNKTTSGSHTLTLVDPRRIGHQVTFFQGQYTSTGSIIITSDGAGTALTFNASVVLGTSVTLRFTGNTENWVVVGANGVVQS